MNKITKTAKEGEKEFDENFDRRNITFALDATQKHIIKSHIASQNKKLIEAVVEEIEKMKKEIINGLDIINQSDRAFNNLMNKGYNKALSDIKQLLTNILKEL